MAAIEAGVSSGSVVWDRIIALLYNYLRARARLSVPVGFVFFRFKDMVPAHHAAARSTIFVHRRAALVVCRPAMISSKMIPVPQSWVMVWESVTSGTGIG